MNTKILNSMWRIILVLVFSLSLIGYPTGPASAAGPYLVNSLADSSDTNIGDGICYSSGAGACTLRAAIEESNAGAGTETVSIGLNGTITLGSSLPDISVNLTIDGAYHGIAVDGVDTYRVIKILSGVTVNLIQLTIINGTGSTGGGILNQGTLNVTESYFIGNAASAIYNDGGTLVVKHSSFEDNTATNGAGIHNYGGNLEVVNSTFSGNTASANGGGIYNYTGNLTVLNSTFSANSATEGGGIYGTFTGGGYFILKNTILANSPNSYDCYSDVAPTADVNNLIEYNNGCGSPISSADPKLGQLAYREGWTPTILLRSGSPALDAGDDSTCTSASVNSLDQRMITRPQGAHCDIGSYEKVAGNTYTVTNLNDSGAGSLRQAILDANTHYYIEDTINFSVSGMIILASTLPDISDDLIIDGTGQSVIIDGNYLYRVMNLRYAKVLTLNKLTIANGLASGTTGGGINVTSGGMLVVTQCSFIGNSAGWGGAIAVQSGPFIVTDSTFNGNYATSGGGAIHLEGGTGIIQNSTFSGNQSADAGGAIRLYSNNLTVVNSTFSGNSAFYNGGAIVTGTVSSILTVVNSTLSGNSVTDSSGQGAGIYNNNGGLILKNSILANSTSGEDCYNTGTLISDVNNLIESHTGCGTPASTADPLLGSLASNLGPTQTFELLTGSPAIDAGDNATCAAGPVLGKDQRGMTRPYGAACDIGSYERNKGVLTTRSVGAYDGWILESGETTNAGGTLDAAGTTFNLGDGAADKQYRAVLSFNTAALPDTAVITKVTLKIRKQAPVGTDPFTILGALRVDIRKPYFGTSLALLVSDFQAASNRLNVGTFNPVPVSNWYTAILLSPSHPFMNKTGTTQFRLRFLTDDNNDNAADYMKFFSGNYATASARPTLIIEYYIP
jgi:CSLREA domain-containing protein